jgi:MFS family permease
MFMGAAWTAQTTRMPLVKGDLGVTAGQLGLILLSTGIGSLVGLNLIGRLIARSGTRRWLLVTYPLLGAGIFLGSILIANHQTAAYVGLSVLMGALMGMTDVSVNVDGTALEKATDRILMPRMHAGYSIGTLIGSGWGALSAALNLDLTLTVLPLAAVQVALPFVLAKHLPATTGIEAATHKDTSKGQPGHWFTFTLVLLGLGILSVTLAEGAATDWMTLGIKNGYGVTDANAGLAFTLFFAGMVLVRYYGGHLADRIGKGRALQLLAAFGVIGVLITILGAPNVVMAWIGAILWGSGVALGFPLFLSVAGEGENAAKKVGFVASWGYGAFLAGPPLLGFVADAFGMLNMFYVIAAFLVVALLVAGAAGKRK